MKCQLPTKVVSPSRAASPCYQRQERHSGPRRFRGFTLLEFLIAMALMAVIALTLIESLHTAFRSRTDVEQSVETSRTAETVMAILRNDLQCAMPPRGVFATGFNGSSNQDPRGNDGDDLSFATTAPSPFHPQGGNGEIKNIEITTYLPTSSTDPDDYLLVRRTTNNLLNPQQETADEEVLCRHVNGLNITYYDPVTQTWLDTWSSSQQNNALPLAVQVILSLPTGRKMADGKPEIARYTRVFAMPCTGPSNDNSSSSSGAASAAPTGGKGDVK